MRDQARVSSGAGKTYSSCTEGARAVVAWGLWAPSFCDLHSEQGDRVRWRWRCARRGWRCHCGSQATCGLLARWRWRSGCDLQSRRGAMSRPASCHVMSRRILSRHVISGHVMLRCYAVSCPVMPHYVISVVPCQVMSLSRPVTLCHAVSCRVLPCRVASCRVAKGGHSTLTQLPHSHTTHTRRSHLHSSYSQHSRSHSLQPHHSHWCARAVLSTSHSFIDFVCPPTSST